MRFRKSSYHPTTIINRSSSCILVMYWESTTTNRDRNKMDSSSKLPKVLDGRKIRSPAGGFPSPIRIGRKPIFALFGILMLYRAFLSSPSLAANRPSTATTTSLPTTPVAEDIMMTQQQQQQQQQQPYLREQDATTKSQQGDTINKSNPQQQKPNISNATEKRIVDNPQSGRKYLDWSNLTRLEGYSPQYSPVFSFLSVNDNDDENGHVGPNKLSLAMPSIQVHFVIDSTSSAPFRSKLEVIESAKTTDVSDRGGRNNNANIPSSDGDAEGDNTSNARGRARQVPEFLLDGIARSPYTHLTGLTSLEPMSELETKFFPAHGSGDIPLLYLVDWGSMNRDCHRLRVVLDTVQGQRYDFDQEQRRRGLLPSILLVDFSSSSRRVTCPFLMDTFAKTDNSKVRFTKRSIVQGRYYNFTTGAIHPGSLLPSQSSVTGTGDSLLPMPVLHSPLVLRESFVMTQLDVTTNRPLSVLDHVRPIDVTCFWKRGDYSHYGFYRRQVAESVKRLHHSIYNNARIEAKVGLSYTDKKQMEDGGIVQYDYVKDLLATKIVVISQRDEWEDHYRLMESLASGALVMSDPMIAPPAGLRHKVNIVFYNDPTELRARIRYYLHPDHESERKTIARRGYELAMGRHRSWHRIEELLFGRPLTNVDQPSEVAPTADTTIPEYESMITATDGRW